MFNPLTPAQVLAAIGSTARAAAAVSEPLDEFQRGQLKSAYSAARHLAIELEAYGPDLSRCSLRVANAARELAPGLAASLDATGDAPAAGAIMCELLDRCRVEADPAWAKLRAEIRGALRELCTREVDLLSAGIEQ